LESPPRRISPHKIFNDWTTSSFCALIITIGGRPRAVIEMSTTMMMMMR
jgi:hypothetical protein